MTNTGAAVAADALYGRRLVLLLSLGHLLSMSDRSLFAAAVPILKPIYAFSDTQLGALLGPAYAVSFGLAALVFGYFADHGHRTILILCGMALWTAASAATGMCDTFWAFAAARAVMALGQAAFIPAALALIVEVSGLRRAAALASFTTASSLGRGGVLLVAGAILAGSTAAGFRPSGGGWRVLFVVTILPNLCLLVPLVRAARAAEVDTGRAAGGQGGHFVWMRANGWTLAGYLLVALPPQIISQGFQSWLPTLLVRTHGMSVPRAATYAGMLTLISAPVGQMAGGWIMTRSKAAQRHPMSTIAIALSLALPFLAMTGVGEGPIAVGPGIVGAGVMIGIALFASLYGLQALVPAARRGMANGTFMAIVTLVGLGSGPVLTGLLSDGPGTLHGLGLEGALLIVGAGSAVTAGIATLMGHRRYARVAAALAASNEIIAPARGRAV